MRCIFTLTPPLNTITKTLKGAHLGMKENESQEIFIFRSSEIHANPVFIINISKQNEIVKGLFIEENNTFMGGISEGS